MVCPVHPIQKLRHGIYLYSLEDGEIFPLGRDQGLKGPTVWSCVQVSTHKHSAAGKVVKLLGKRALSSSRALRHKGQNKYTLWLLEFPSLFLGSGESGAGKTESMKLLLQHIMNLCKGNSQLEQQILQVGLYRMVLVDAGATLLQGSLQWAQKSSWWITPGSLGTKHEIHKNIVVKDGEAADHKLEGW